MNKNFQETVFWKNFIYYCNLKNVKPNNVTKAIGLSNATATDWKNGSTPRDTTLKKIADYFGIPVSALTSDSPEPLSGSAKPSPFLTTPENEKESRVLFAYRSQPEMQPAVDKLLGVSEDGETVTVYAAAQSTPNRKHVITQIPKNKWEEIENEPNTDDELL